MFNFLNNLFKPGSQDGGSIVGHLVGLAALAFATPEGQATASSILNAEWGWMVPVLMAYFGGARAGQPSE